MILIIDNYDSFTYNLYQMIAQFDSQAKVVRNDRITLDEIDRLNPSGIVLSPGPRRPEEAGICIELIRAFYKSVPILGVCLGHQAIACAFGGKVIQSNQIVHGKSTFIFHQKRNIFANMPLPFEAGRYHSLIVEKETLPKTLILEAENDEGIVMAIKHANYPVYGLQFHPESILTDCGKELMHNFLKEVDDHAKGLY